MRQVSSIRSDVPLAFVNKGESCFAGSRTCVAIKTKAGYLECGKLRLRCTGGSVQLSDNAQPQPRYKLGSRQCAKIKYTVIILQMRRVVSAFGLFDLRYRPASRYCMKISATAAIGLMTISSEVGRP